MIDGFSQSKRTNKGQNGLVVGCAELTTLSAGNGLFKYHRMVVEVPHSRRIRSSSRSPYHLGRPTTQSRLLWQPGLKAASRFDDAFELSQSESNGLALEVMLSCVVCRMFSDVTGGRQCSAGLLVVSARYMASEVCRETTRSVSN